MSARLLFEKLIWQFTIYLGLQQYDILSNVQHGFVLGKSTITNVLSSDAVIASTILKEHAYDIISFDFKSAFDKVPHRVVIEALAVSVVYRTALSWYGSFLSGRLQQVKVGNCIPFPCDVVSGVAQGSTCRSGLYTLVADTLLQIFSLPHLAFVDDFKFIADIAIYTQSRYNLSGSQ